MFFLRNLSAVIIASGLAACGAGGSDTDGGGNVTDGGSVGRTLNFVTAAERETYLTTFLADYASVLDASDNNGPVNFATLPSGSVTYQGYMQLLIEGADVSADVIGEMGLEVDLASETFSGSASGFFGSARAEDGRSDIARYEGEIVASGGDVTLTGSAGDTFSFDISGSLDNGLNTFGVEGEVVGAIYDNGEGLRALAQRNGLVGTLETTIDGVASLESSGSATISAVKAD